MTRVGDIMTQDFHVIPANATLAEAAMMMARLDVGMLPVTEQGRLRGTITDRDIATRAVGRGLDPGRTPVSRAMTPEVVFLHEDDDIEQAARLMQEKQVRRLVVADRERRPLGIVSLSDLSADTELAGKVLARVSEPSC